MATPPPVFHSISLSADHFHDGKSSSFYSILERAATTAVASVVDLTATVSREGHRLGRLYHEGGLRTIVTGAPNEFGNRAINGSTDVSILCSLRCLEFESLIFGGQRGNLVLSQEVQNCTAVRIGVLNHVAGGVLDGVLHGAGISSHLILYISNSGSVVAAALSDLSGQVVAVLEDRGVQTVEALAQRTVDAVNAGQNRVGSESRGQVSLSGRSATARIAIAATVTSTIAAEAIAPPPEQQEDDDPNLLP